MQVRADGFDVGAVEEVQASFVDAAAAGVPVVGIVQHRPQRDEQGRKRQQIDAEEAQGRAVAASAQRVPAWPSARQSPRRSAQELKIRRRGGIWHGGGTIRGWSRAGLDRTQDNAAQHITRPGGGSGANPQSPNGGPTPGLNCRADAKSRAKSKNDRELRQRLYPATFDILWDNEFSLLPEQIAPMRSLPTVR